MAFGYFRQDIWDTLHYHLNEIEFHPSMVLAVLYLLYFFALSCHEKLTLITLSTYLAIWLLSWYELSELFYLHALQNEENQLI